MLRYHISCSFKNNNKSQIARHRDSKRLDGHLDLTLPLPLRSQSRQEQKEQTIITDRVYKRFLFNEYASLAKKNSFGDDKCTN